MLRNLQKAAGYGIPFLLKRLQRPANMCRIIQAPTEN
jgi:predicted transcriptional regulator